MAACCPLQAGLRRLVTGTTRPGRLEEGERPAAAACLRRAVARRGRPAAQTLVTPELVVDELVLLLLEDLHAQGGGVRPAAHKAAVPAAAAAAAAAVPTAAAAAAAAYRAKEGRKADKDAEADCEGADAGLADCAAQQRVQRGSPCSQTAPAVSCRRRATPCPVCLAAG